ncbi:hypothetical protein CIT292_07676 [Citrobacter youngae ATCC 29220]|uniref:Uncharacterized protein n=1 Tax=Citrobacter youngae ATCC 29220 TaxID=500640 RepID=D4BB29_9ENTR|nr:hypothetical protein CIT292_07676 [Citrobacter youngae ATCC 29220]
MPFWVSGLAFSVSMVVFLVLGYFIYIVFCTPAFYLIKYFIAKFLARCCQQQ